MNAIAAQGESTVCTACGGPVPAVLGMNGKVLPMICEACDADRERKGRAGLFRQHLARTGIDPSLWSYDRKRAPDPTLLDWCVEHASSWLWLGGPTGAGKSRALARAAVVHAWRKRQWPTMLWVDCASWFATLGDTSFDGRKDTAAAVRRAEAVDLLILDDLGQEKLQDSTRAALFGILNQRYTRRLLTWASTNASGAELEERFGKGRWPQIRRRFAERGWFRTWAPERGWTSTTGQAQEEGPEPYWWEEL